MCVHRLEYMAQKCVKLHKAIVCRGSVVVVLERCYGTELVMMIITVIIYMIDLVSENRIIREAQQ